MKLKIKNFVLALLCISLLSTGCNKSPNKTNTEDQLALKETQIQDLQASLTTQEALVTQLTSENDALQQEIDQLKEKTILPTNTPISQVLTVIDLIANKDMNALSKYVHPTKGVRFSPYGYIDVTKDLVFTPDQLATLMEDKQTYVWGNYDGSGDPIIKTFEDYYAQFIYDQDFINPQIIGNNMVIGTGNSLINIAEVYPNGIFIEFHFKGFDPQYEGIDWESLRLVFEEQDGTWYLVGVVHDQWTI